MSGWLSNLVDLLGPPCTMFSTPLGAPASINSSTSRTGVSGILLGGLEHEGIAAGDRQGVHPQGDHGGEVERGDAGETPMGWM